MKISYGKTLRSIAVALFSLSLASGLHAATAAEMYEGMISSALAKSTTADKLDALNGLAAVMGNVDADTAKEINPEFTSAITTVYNEAQANADLRPALQKMLTNASNSVVLDAGQKATVAQWLSGLAMASQAKTLDANAMQQLATSGSDMLNKIAALDKEVDDSKRLEGIYHLLQEAQGKTFSNDVQEAFGRLVVKAFNNSTEIYSYIQQVLHEIAEQHTPLLADAQIDYVTKEMLPRVTTPAAQAEAAKDAKAAAKEDKKGKGKKGLKKAKKADGAAATEAPGKDKKGKKKKGKKGAATGDAQAAAVDADGDGKPDTPAADHVAKGKKKKGKKAKAAAAGDAQAAIVDADGDGKPDTPAAGHAPKGKKKKGKKAKAAQPAATAAEAPADHAAAPEANAAAAA